MKEILIKEMVVLVDDEDFARVNQYKWYLSRRQNTSYAHTKINGRGVFMHRYILRLPYKVGEVDHVDRNGLNNQKANLRLVTHAENMKNTKRLIENPMFCGKGHLLDGVRLRVEGGRYCKTCNTLNKRKQRMAGKPN